MKSRGIILALLALPILTTFLILTLTRTHEPRYQGRSLSEWLAVCSAHARTQDSPEFKKASHAVRNIGTNALPYLLKKIRQEPLPWGRRAYQKLPAFLTRTAEAADFLLSGPGYQAADDAVAGFYFLGTNGAPAIPQLEIILSDTNRPATAQRATMALGSLGATAFPHMVAALANTNLPNRRDVAFYLAAFMPAAVGTNACLPPLKAALNDPDPQVRSTAAQMLKLLAPEIPTNTPAE